MPLTMNHSLSFFSISISVLFLFFSFSEIKITAVPFVNTTNLQRDSLAYKKIKDSIKFYKKKGDFFKAIDASEKLIVLASKNRDTFYLANGFANKAFYQRKANLNNVAFENFMKSVQLYLQIADSVRAAKMLVNVVSIQNDMGDFSGAQQTASQGLLLLNKKDEPKTSFKFYSSLGNAMANMDDFDLAADFYDQAIEIAPSKQNKASARNNLANTLRKTGKVGLALANYKLALIDSAHIETTTKARLLDNLGYLLETEGLNGLPLMERALELRISENELRGQFASYIHLTDSQIDKNRQLSRKFAFNALETAKILKSPDAEREALSYVIRFEPNSDVRLSRYVHLNDSLRKAQNKERNKFAGVRFKVFETQQKNELLQESINVQQLKMEKQRLLQWVIFGFLIMAVLFISIYFRKYKKEQKDRRTIAKQKERIELLQRELHHRLKNNLGVLDLFVQLAKDEFPDPAYQQKLTELENRMHSMFSVHGLLFQNNELQLVKGKTHLSRLTNNVVNTFNNEHIALTIDIDEAIDIPANLSYPISIIVNEFVTNSFKHAFPGATDGQIIVHLSENQTHFHLTLKDNGVGLPPNFSIENTTSFGMEAMQLLTIEYDGTFEIITKNGLSLKVSLPKTSHL